jgi:hypothetical protein
MKLFQAAEGRAGLGTPPWCGASWLLENVLSMQAASSVFMRLGQCVQSALK